MIRQHFDGKRNKKIPFPVQRLLILFVACFVAISSMAWAQQEAEDDENLDALPTVVAIRVSSTTVRARLVIDMGSVTAFSFVSLADPIAIAIDVHASGLEATTDGVPSGEGVIASYTLEQIEADRVRTVLLLN